MNLGYENLNNKCEFKDRLNYLYKLVHNIDTKEKGWSLSAAKKIFSKNILEYNDSLGDDIARNKQIMHVKRTLERHLNETVSAENLSGQWISIYCKFFKCSCDYLMGYISNPTKGNTDMHQKTGLNDVAIKTLSSWYKYQNEMKEACQEQTYLPIETLNILLSDNYTAELLLNSIQELFQTDYNIPVYHNGESEDVYINDKYSKVSIPKCIAFNNDLDVIKGQWNFPDLYLLTLVKDKEKTWDNRQIPLDDDFFEAVAIRKIQKHLLDIRKNYFRDK